MKANNTQKNIKKVKAANPGPQITGHSWDGITEYDNPDPKWLRWLFYAMLFFGLCYWILYPAWPSQNNHGLLNWTSSKQIDEAQLEIQQIRKPYLEKFNKSSFNDIMNDKELMKFAIAGGKAHFQNNCAVCHGVGGRGNIGFPNLTTGAWIWGGTIDEIYKTIKYGIRSGHDESRMSEMPAFGKDKILTVDEINLLVHYVSGLYNKAAPNPDAEKLFKQHCASCHGEHGQGNREIGAIDLSSAIWVYGRDEAFKTIYYGRAGVMPFWINKLDDSTIKQLSIYVHQLGGGE